MSLKAKIEAVIYASEEPVTLLQLVSLLGEEGQSELANLASQQESLPLDEPAAEADANAEALNAETLGEPAEPEPQLPELNVDEESAAPSPEAVTESAEASAETVESDSGSRLQS